MAAPHPILSIIIPTKDRPDLVMDAVRSALEPIEFSREVIVSDCSQGDATEHLLIGAPVSYIRRDSKLDMVDHWNLALASAKGKYVKFLCDDDWLLPEALAREVGKLERNSHLVAVASQREERDAETGKLLRTLGESIAFESMGNALYRKMVEQENVLGPPSCVTFRRDVLKEFPRQYQYACDWAAWIKISDRGAFGFIPFPGCVFRIHGKNATSRFVDEGVDFIEVMALRRECLRRLKGFSAITGRLQYALLFFYRLGRRMLRLLFKGKNPFVFLARAFFESRKPI